MIGILVVAHGELAEALITSVQVLVGKLQKIRAVAVRPRDGREEFRQRIQEQIIEVDEGDGVIILTDMLGGTPTNLSLAYLKEEHAEVITGVNLPMLLLLVSHRGEKSLDRLAVMAKKAGRRSITLPRGFLGERGRQNGTGFLPMFQNIEYRREKGRGTFVSEQKENPVVPM